VHTVTFRSQSFSSIKKEDAFIKTKQQKGLDLHWTHQHTHPHLHTSDQKLGPSWTAEQPMMSQIKLMNH